MYHVLPQRNNITKQITFYSAKHRLHCFHRPDLQGSIKSPIAESSTEHSRTEHLSVSGLADFRGWGDPKSQTHSYTSVTWPVHSLQFERGQTTLRCLCRSQLKFRSTLGAQAHQSWLVLQDLHCLHSRAGIINTDILLLPQNFFSPHFTFYYFYSKPKTTPC